MRNYVVAQFGIDFEENQNSHLEMSERWIHSCSQKYFRQHGKAISLFLLMKKWINQKAQKYSHILLF
jgi:hypothetical protein